MNTRLVAAAALTAVLASGCSVAIQGRGNPRPAAKVLAGVTDVALITAATSAGFAATCSEDASTEEHDCEVAAPMALLLATTAVALAAVTGTIALAIPPRPPTALEIAPEPASPVITIDGDAPVDVLERDALAMARAGRCERAGILLDELATRDAARSATLTASASFETCRTWWAQR